MKKTKAPRASAIAASETVVIVFEGKKQKRYTLHKRLLTYHSGYFRQVLDDGSKIHHVPAVAEFYPMHFDIIIDWMYERSLPALIDMGSDDDVLNAYILAENLSIGTFQNALMDILFDWLPPCFLSAEDIGTISGRLPENDPLLRLATDIFCSNGWVEKMSNGRPEWVDHLPQAFLLCVIRRMYQLGQLPEADRKLKREDYDIVECVTSEDKDGE
ncbi:hypothetical protein J4E83_006427 [Alternaria metachromatica]|uniref:uncharacterized protein n=1 Tax=Alternaria metachromatica TaxID=283354 RepID=UPI0020C3ACA2|nr:uncharacterized protein J4E83_006427 [Alternaria metachromatica]KAI4616846.1 hypothetical protein J4E83_006427 [Alternaria metachromatica]